MLLAGTTDTIIELWSHFVACRLFLAQHSSGQKTEQLNLNYVLLLQCFVLPYTVYGLLSTVCYVTVSLMTSFTHLYCEMVTVLYSQLYGTINSARCSVDVTAVPCSVIEVVNSRTPAHSKEAVVEEKVFEIHLCMTAN